MAGEGYVLLLGAQSTVELLGLRGDPGEPLELYRAALRRGGGRLLERLRRGLESGAVRSIVYLGADGALSRLLSRGVVEVYGAVSRLRCPRCGRRWWIDEGERCPRCGGPGEPDYSETPRRRQLEEAIYELTTAEAVAVHGLGEPPPVLGSVLALAASRFTRVSSSSRHRPSSGAWGSRRRARPWRSS
ncbi:hypothetical protein CF15_08025 [Pyrodictium occultum]|uniref:Deacetylase sirtuin-type domain-containing protein n=1 Tax=Pyrodictium occultum TaxID=2309 RepID=A0A0V8RRW6_PYROC|nr:hypothetical protein [Pyrodictium occultum]KSW10722.1 hypothetical protein CF15_08025 [Pyrodictium occultum]